MRITAILTAMVILLSFAGCTGGFEVSSQTSNPISSTAAPESQSEQSNAKIEVEEDLLTVSITIPASMYEGQDMSKFDTESYIAEQNFKDAVINDDGSVTITMTKKRHKEILKEYADKVEETFAEMCSDEDTPYIKEIQHDSDFKKFTVTVDRAGYEAAKLDFSGMAISISAKMYQMFSGGDGTCSIDYIDADTNEIIETKDI